jgi:mRNA export factor
MAFLSSASTGVNSTYGNLNSDIALTSPPEDSISDISFSKKADLLAVASWDRKVRIYEISSTGSSAGKAAYEHEAPVLSVHWSSV